VLTRARHAFTSGVNLTVRDLVHFFRVAYAIIADADVDVLLPSASRRFFANAAAVNFSTLEELTQLYGLNIIGPQTMREHAARHQGVHPDHVIKGRGGDLIPKQVSAQRQPLTPFSSNGRRRSQRRQSNTHNRQSRTH